MATERFCVTYDVITPESAEDGDSADRGFASPGGWRHDDRALMTLREALSVAGGPFEDSGSWWSTIDADTDYRTGEDTFYAIHPPQNVTRASYARVSRLLGARR